MIMTNKEKLNQLKQGDTVYFVDVIPKSDFTGNRQHISFFSSECIKRTFIGIAENSVMTIEYSDKEDFEYTLEFIHNAEIKESGAGLHRISQVFASQKDADKYIEYLKGKTNNQTLISFASTLINKMKLKELTTEEEAKLQKLGYVAIFMRPNNILEFRGAIHKTYKCNENELFEGEKIYIEELEKQFGFDGKTPYISVQHVKNSFVFHDYIWRINTNLPYASFNIFESESSRYIDNENEYWNLDAGDVYCEALLIKLE